MNGGDETGLRTVGVEEEPEKEGQVFVGLVLVVAKDFEVVAEGG